MVSDSSKADFARDDRDIEQILALNQGEYGPTSPSPSTDAVLTRASFDWRRDQNPAGQAVIPVIRNTAGDLVGFLWLIPLRMRIRKQDFRAATAANLVVEGAMRGTFGYTKLMRKFSQALKDCGAALHFSFVSEENFRRLRADSPQTTFTVPLLLKPIDFKGLAQGYLTAKWQRFLVGKAGWILSPLFFRWSVFRRGIDISIEVIDQFDKSFDDFWGRVQDKYRALVIRDRAFLNWRFTPVSGRRYHILVARLKGEMLGYSVIRCANVRGVQTGLILDLLLLDTDQGREAGVQLIAYAEAFFRSQKTSLMAALMAPWSAEYRILGLMGCRNLAPLVNPRPFRFAFFVQDAHCEDLKSLSVEDWFITLADFESL
jgi:hypothetical protein